MLQPIDPHTYNSSNELKASSSTIVQTNEKSNRLLAFSLCNEEYAIPLLKVKEVIAYSDITSVPFTPTYFKGILNLRGLVISIIDLRAKFKMTNPQIGSETAIIILDLAPLYLGIVVDSVNSVVAITGNDLSPPPDVEPGANTAYITNVVKKDKKLLLLLDIDKTLNAEDMRLIHTQNSKKTA